MSGPLPRKRSWSTMIGSNIQGSTFDVNQFIDMYLKNNERMPQNRILISKPTEVGCFSRDSSSNFHINSRKSFKSISLSELNLALPLDLNTGFEEFQKTYEDSGPDSLEYVLKASKNLRQSGYIPDIIAWRGALRTIMTTPYSLKEQYSLGVWKRNGVLYIQTRKDLKDFERVFQNMEEQQQRYMYYGYKFEQVCVERKKLQNAPADAISCFGSVLKSKIGEMKVLFGAEVDCYDENTKEHVELKITKQFTKDRDRYTFERYKLLKWYSQSFLAGTTQLLVGFRDQAGYLQKLQQFETLKIPRLIRGRESDLWCPVQCITFLEKMLEWLMQVVPEMDNNSQVFAVQYSPRDRKIHLHKSERQIYEKIPEALYF